MDNEQEKDLVKTDEEGVNEIEEEYYGDEEKYSDSLDHLKRRIEKLQKLRVQVTKKWTTLNIEDKKTAAFIGSVIGGDGDFIKLLCDEVLYWIYEQTGSVFSEDDMPWYYGRLEKIQLKVNKLTAKVDKYILSLTNILEVNKNQRRDK